MVVALDLGPGAGVGSSEGLEEKLQREVVPWTAPLVRVSTSL